MSKLQITKEALIDAVKNRFDKISEKPRVITPFGFSIDGRRLDKDNFKELFFYLREQGHTHSYIRDADNQVRELTTVQIGELYKIIIQFSFELYQAKWNILQQINQASTIEELNSISIELLSPDGEITYV